MVGCHTAHIGAGHHNLHIAGDAAGITAAVNRLPVTGLNGQICVVHILRSVKHTQAALDAKIGFTIAVSIRQGCYIFADHQLVAFTADELVRAGCAQLDGDIIKGGGATDAHPLLRIAVCIGKLQCAAGDQQRIAMGRQLIGASGGCDFISTHNTDGAGSAFRCISHNGIQLGLCLANGRNRCFCRITIVVIAAACAVQIDRKLAERITHGQGHSCAGFCLSSGCIAHLVVAHRQVGNLGSAGCHRGILCCVRKFVFVNFGRIQTGDLAGTSYHSCIHSSQAGRDGCVFCQVDKAIFIQIVDIAVDGEHTVGGRDLTHLHQGTAGFFTVYIGHFCIGHIRLHKASQNQRIGLIHGKDIRAIGENYLFFLCQLCQSHCTGVLLQLYCRTSRNEFVGNALLIHQIQYTLSKAFSGGQHISGRGGTGALDHIVILGFVGGDLLSAAVFHVDQIDLLTHKVIDVQFRMVRGIHIQKHNVVFHDGVALLLHNFFDFCHIGIQIVK